ncbi:MAG TPA: alpha/beta hydrolase [Paraburkholderia sp.]|uniref:alpha/beta hydrolase n=1 Tax=Paraburkholderia sp. TaxID=1926495 RepID=UPI002B47D819|nr:alpha/beta hydrolase [Paraburkholderia sp.]HKR43802.1 alpha/beta hydrolase [Paraburkholderia sp.]
MGTFAAGRREVRFTVGLRASTYRLLAEGLLEKWIASVRIDKRGMYGSATAIPDADGVTINDYATDVHAWVTTIQARTGASCVWVLGLSEGGLEALLVAQQTTDICGLILVSTAGYPLEQVLRQQLQSRPNKTAAGVAERVPVGSRQSMGRFQPPSSFRFGPGQLALASVPSCYKFHF